MGAAETAAGACHNDNFAVEANGHGKPPQEMKYRAGE